MSGFDPARVRPLFPSLAREIAGKPALFLDGPGGTQVPTPVTAAMRDYLERSNANIGGLFATSRETGELTQATRAAVAVFLNATSPDEISFGQNMTSVTFAASRALARDWKPGDEVVVTTLDHDANVASWMHAAEDRGAAVRVLHCEKGDCTLSPAKLAALLSPRTRLVALTCASNAVGTIPDVASLIDTAHRAGALVYLDAVHYAPHAPIDVQALGCDLLACSAYKFCGPHLGILWGRKALLEALRPYKVRPASSAPPGKMETGTQNFEAIAGLRACLGYFGSMGGGVLGAQPLEAKVERGAAPTMPTGLGPNPASDPLSRLSLSHAMALIRDHEAELSRRFLDGLAGIRGVRVHGIADPRRVKERTPTFGITIDGLDPRAAAERLGERGVFTWSGHFYAVGLVEELGLADKGGLLRLGFAHYNTLDEVERTLEEVRRLAKS